MLPIRSRLVPELPGDGKGLPPCAEKASAEADALIVFYRGCNIFQGTIQHSAELAERFGLYVIICPQAADGFTVDPALFSELIGADTLFFHCEP